MLGFIKKLFCSKPVESTAEVPYKVEAQPTTVATMPMSTPYAEPPTTTVKKAPAAKQPAGKKPPVARAKTPRTSKK